MQDKGVYDPAALRGWKVVTNDGRPRWQLYGGGGAREKGFPDRVLFEDVLGDVERKLLGTDPEAYDYVLKGSSRPRR